MTDRPEPARVEEIRKRVARAQASGVRDEDGTALGAAVSDLSFLLARIADLEGERDELKEKADGLRQQRYDLKDNLAQARAEERERIEYALRMTEGLSSADTVRSHIREIIRLQPNGSPGERGGQG